MLKDELSSFAEADAANEPVLNGQLPTRLRLLCVGPREPSWVGLTLQLDAEGGIEPQFRWVSNATEALTLLRDDPFDAVLIAAVSTDEDQPQGASPGSDRTNRTLARSGSSENAHPDAFADAASLVKAIRASGCEDPLVLLAPRISDADWLDLSREECELLQSARLWDSPALASVLKRAIFRSERTRQSRRLEIAQPNGWLANGTRPSICSASNGGSSTILMRPKR